ncbi:hypothetical protein BGZ79_005126, partial [Entomortierella chlamydospora]
VYKSIDPGYAFWEPPLRRLVYHDHFSPTYDFSLKIFILNSTFEGPSDDTALSMADNGLDGKGSGQRTISDEPEILCPEFSNFVPIEGGSFGKFLAHPRRFNMHLEEAGAVCSV